MTIRNGENGYTDTLDTELDDSSPTKDNSTKNEVELDTTPTRIGLLRFDNIFGPGAGQIPLGATITSASLTVEVGGPSVPGANISLHRMLTGWTELSNWNSMGNGIQLDDVEAKSAADAIFPDGELPGTQVITGLQAAVQAWSDGDPNHGWALFIDNNTPWKAYLSEEPDVFFRPLLTVEFNGGGGMSTIVTNTNDAGAGSLRQAIANANAQGGTDTISFNIPLTDPNHYYYRDDGIANSLSLEATTVLDDASITDFDPDYPGAPHSWFRIQPVSAMPDITDTVIIDSYTQTGAQENTVAAPGLSNAVLKIEINGDASGGTNLFRTQSGADFNEFRGLVINGDFARPLRLGSNSNTVAGNYIGTDVTGTQLSLSGNLINQHAVIIQSSGQSNTIGGFIPEDCNIISASTGDGVRITSSGSINNVVSGNYIGTDITGSIALGSNNGVRIRSGANNNTIGGVGVAGNVISGAVTTNVRVTDSPSNTIQGNLIGTNASGSGPISAPAQQGIRITNSADTLIGGTFAGEGNVIAYHTEVGVQLDADAGTGTSILGNAIFSNDDAAPGTGLGIDLNDDCVTPNDLDDLDTGANDLQNFPVLTSANTDGVGTFYVGGVIQSTASRAFRIEVFASTFADPSGNGEGETYLGFVNATTDTSGNTAFSAVFLTTVPENAFITATATDQVTDDTSEFSPYVIAQDMGHVIVDTTADVADAPDTSSITALLTDRGSDDLISLREAILATNDSPNLGIPDQIYFNIPDIDSGHVYYRDDSTANSLSLVVPTLQDDATITDFDPDYPGPGHSWFSIQPTSDLPPITDAVSIDGYTQPGASANTLPAGNDAILFIELDGSNTTDGIHADTANVTLHGLVINQVPNDEGVVLGDGGGHVVAGNFIGTDITSTLAKGNKFGIKVESPDNTIGGTSPAARNVISGNTDTGIIIETVGGTGNQVQGNFIGTDVSGTADLGNTKEGVYHWICR